MCQSNRTPGDNTGYKLHKNAVYCFEQIQEATVRSVISHLNNHPSKMNAAEGIKTNS